MNKDLHDIDKLFRSALKGHEEIPSAGVKERLDAALDKKDADSYKKRFIIWKRTALLLLLLLAGFVLYDSGILKTGSGPSGESGVDKKNNPFSGEKNKEVYQNNTAVDNTNKDEPGSFNKYALNDSVDITTSRIAENDNILTQPIQKETTVPAITRLDNKTGSGKNPSVNKIEGQTNEFINKSSNTFTVNEKNLFQSGIDKNLNRSLISNSPVSKEKANPLQPLQKINISEISSWLVNSIKQFRSPVISDTVSKTTKQKKNRVFKSFWMITGVASYDRAGYKLDSDEPSAISSIKYREAHEPSFSLGLLMTRQFSSRWGLQSGIIYANSAIGMKPQKTYAFQDPTGDVAYKYITSSGYAFIKPGFGPQPTAGDSLTTAEAKHTIENITVPLAIKYTMPGKKISITPGAGVEASFITKANLEVDIEDPFNWEIVIVRKLNGTKSFYWSFVADAEIKYAINKKLSINVRPVYRTAITPITKNNVVETFPHSFGIGAGITIKL